MIKLQLDLKFIKAVLQSKQKIKCKYFKISRYK